MKLRIHNIQSPLTRACSLVASAALFISLPALADWTLNASESSLHYVTSKAGAVSEVNSFSELDGGISAGGEATVVITLASVDTMIDIRNERMRDIVFKTGDHPLATVSADISELSLDSMGAGDTVSTELPVTLSMNGMNAEISASVRVTRLSNGGVQVDNTAPILLNVATLGYSEGVEELRNLAGLPGINPNISVDFSLQYDED